MLIYIIIFLVCVVILIIVALSAKQKPQQPAEPPKPARPPLSDAEKEAIRQADEAFDWQTHKAIVNGTYTGPLPEHVAFDLWTDLYPDIYSTRIAGINFCRGIKDLAGQYFDCQIIADPKNRHDKNAIKILHADGRHLGFIPADETDSVRTFLSDQIPYANCRAHIDEGTEYNEVTGRDRHYLYGTINIHRPKSN